MQIRKLHVKRKKVRGMVFKWRITRINKMEATGRMMSVNSILMEKSPGNSRIGKEYIPISTQTKSK